MNVAVRKAATEADGGALKKRAAQLRGKIIEMSHAAQAAHLASSLSCADVLTAAYWHVLNVIRNGRMTRCGIASSCPRDTPPRRYTPCWR